MNHPVEGQTKPCTKCGEIAVFSRKVAIIEREGNLYRDRKPGPAARYTTGWYCSNGKCEFTEALPSEVPS